MIERMGFGTAAVRTGTERVDLRPGKALTLGLGVSATSADELDGAVAFVWTNYGSGAPEEFRTVAMTPVQPADGYQRAFEAKLGPAPLGTFVATETWRGLGTGRSSTRYPTTVEMPTTSTTGWCSG